MMKSNECDTTPDIDNYSTMSVAFEMMRTVLVISLVCCVTTVTPSQNYSCEGLNSQEPCTDLTIDQIIGSMDENETDTILTLGINDTVNTRQRRRILYPLDSIPLWTNAIIPYTFTSDFDDQEIYSIKRAMTEWERYTCVKFKEAGSSDQDSVKIFSGYGCFSYIGSIGGVQKLSLQMPGCKWHMIYLHEFGHTLGLVHEHQLPSRDKFIRINYKNVYTDYTNNFDKYSSTTANLPYDYSSIMHYGPTAFSRNGNPTIVALQLDKANEMGKAKELSFDDVKSINMMYNCNSHCLSKILCTNGGFVNQNCECTCVDGTSDCQADCMNSNQKQLCDYWAENGYCNNIYYKPYMSLNCAKSCGTCARKADCMNSNQKQLCDYWAANGYCNNIYYKPDMSLNCAKSCGTCARKDECINSNKSCDSLAVTGECNRNPGWMFINCAKACGKCDREAELCTNVHEPGWKCAIKANQGECERSPVYMTNNCKNSCHSCNDTDDQQSKEVCENKYRDDKCNTWTKRGDCITNPCWMKQKCRKACQFCQQDRTLPDNCQNNIDNGQCQVKALFGECTTNSTWMKTNCGRACRSCDGGGVSTLPTTTV